MNWVHIGRVWFDDFFFARSLTGGSPSKVDLAQN